MEALKLLLVDDNNDNLESLEFLLEGMDAEIIRANSGQKAIDLIDAHEFALILMDVAMPGMDGIEAANQIRLKRNIPIIFLTAHANSEEFLLKGYESGAVDYITKPIQTEALKSKVDIFLTIGRQKQMLSERSNDLVESNWRLEKEIRERGELENKFRELSQTYKSVLNSTIELGIIAVNKKLQFLFVNKTAELIFGYSNEDIKGKSVYDIHKIEQVDDDKLEVALREVGETGEHRFLVKRNNSMTHYLDCKIIAMLEEEGCDGGYIFSMKEIKN